jgi:hypothetical protein
MDMQSGVEYQYQDSDPLRSDVNLGTSKREGGRHFRAAGFFPRSAGEDLRAGQYSFFQSLQPSAARTHGSIFYYKCCDTGVLGWACEKVTGSRFAELISSYIWSRIGAERDSYIVSDVQGTCAPYAGMSVTLRDLARWGQMHLQFGSWEGRQIIPRKFIEDVQRNHDAAKIKPESFLSSNDLLPGTAYRSQFWIPGTQTDAFYSGGAYGQYCYIHPESECVVVRFATQDPGLESPVWGKIIPKMFTEIAEAIV